jgi:oxalate decarboxylase/phosphoglucose isomerase-like protein (cupin superfamily)
MSDGLMLPPGQGRTLGAGITLKVSAEQAASASSFEIIVPPGYDVGAHVHARQEELFYILEGELDLFAFEPVTRTDENWRIWQSRTGAQVFRGGPGSLMFVPPGCPHAFANPGTAPARMLFQAAPAGHEGYFEELLAILKRGGPPDPEVIAALRKRYDIEQLTPLIPGQGFPQS